MILFTLSICHSGFSELYLTNRPDVSVGIRDGLLTQKTAVGYRRLEGIRVPQPNIAAIKELTIEIAAVSAILKAFVKDIVERG